MESVFITLLSPDNYLYDNIQINWEGIKHLILHINSANKLGNGHLKLDAVFVHYFVKELTESDFYRNSFIKLTLYCVLPRVIVLKPTTRDLIDYRWNECIYYLVRERCELDHTLSWLSTLGGAFSALGDYFEKCADTAGKISMHQLKLAIRLGDPNVASRCRLYLSLSLIQKKKYKIAANVIKAEYCIAKGQSVIDERLINMCKGIWAKLQYEHKLYLKSNKINR